jgi:hypothetical protein
MQTNLLSKRWQWIALLAILLLTATIQIHELDRVSLWADEGWTIATTGVSSPDKVITEWVAVDVHPPLFFLELWAWRQFTGDTVFEMRYFSVLVTLTATAIIYRAVTALFHSQVAGMTAALFLGVHDLVNVLTQEVRHYSQQQLMAALALWMYARFWDKPNRNRGIAFALAGAGLIWSHYWGGFLLLGMVIHAMITRRNQLQALLLGFVGIGLLLIPWLPAIYSQITEERPDGLPHALNNSWVVYKTIAFQVVGIPEIFWLSLAGLAIVGPVLVPPFNWRNLQRIHPSSLLLGLIVILTVGLSILFNAFYPTLSFRSLAVVIPALAGLVGYSLTFFGPRERLFLIVFIVIQSLATTSANPVPRAPWPEVANYLSRHTTSDELILFELDTDEHAVAYYLEQIGADIDWVSTETERDRNPNTFETYLANLLAEQDQVWVAKIDWPFYDIRNDLLKLGFVQTAPNIEWPLYIGRPIELWRFERVDGAQEQILAQFGERFVLHRASITRHPEWVTVNLLWSPIAELDDQYTVSVFLLHESGAILTPESQHDSWPLDGQSPTQDWQPGKFYFDSHAVDTTNLPPGDYQIGLKIYHPVDGDYSNLEILTPSSCADEACTYTIIDTVTLN